MDGEPGAPGLEDEEAPPGVDAGPAAPQYFWSRGYGPAGYAGGDSAGAAAYANYYGASSYYYPAFNPGQRRMGGSMVVRVCVLGGQGAREAEGGGSRGEQGRG